MTAHRSTTRLRWRIKQGLARAIGAVRSRAAARRSGSGYRPLVLGYHRVVEDFEATARTEMGSMLISTKMFEQHLDCIGRHFRFVDLDAIGEAAQSGRPFDTPVAAVTFDDGYRDVYELAVPILKRKGIPAAAFVVTDLVGQPRWQVHDKLYHLIAKGYEQWPHPRRQMQNLLSDMGVPAPALSLDTRSPSMAVSSLLPHLSRTDTARVMQHLEWIVGNGFVNVPESMTWPMLKSMRQDGFTIGSHTRSHVSLPMEPADVTHEELSGSKQALESALGCSIDHFAYPGGQFTPAVVERLDACGYRYAYTACQHQDPRYPALTIERLLLWEGSSIDADGRFSPAILQCQAQDFWPPARVCHRAHT